MKKRHFITLYHFRTEYLDTALS